VWLKTTGLAALPLTYIEDHGMGMKLWRGIPIDWPGSIVLESGGNESPCSLRRVHVSNPGLRVSL
jgi:hypothetical protein